jgi:hypothetical protein
MLQQNPKIIPHNILVFDWKALDCTLEALETLGKSYELRIAKRKEKIDSLSYAHAINAQRLSFTTHATDTYGFLSHLSCNVTIASKLGFEWITNTCEVEFEKVFDELDWIPSEHWSTHIALLEKKLR